jgi:hypothetical protein
MVSFRILRSSWPSLHTSNFVNGIDYVCVTSHTECSRSMTFILEILIAFGCKDVPRIDKISLLYWFNIVCVLSRDNGTYIAPTGTSARAKCKKISYVILEFKVVASATLKIEAARSFETSVKSYKSSRLFWNVGKLIPDYTASYSSRQYSSYKFNCTDNKTFYRHLWTDSLEKCGNFDVSQFYGPPRPLTGIALPFFVPIRYIYRLHKIINKNMTFKI